jgi:hypothetical protein
MWPEIIPLLAEYAIPTIQGLTAAGQKLSETGDPLKALLAGGGTAAGGVLGGKALGAVGGNVARMAGGGDPATLSGKLYNAVETAAPSVGQFLGQSWGGGIGGNLANTVSGVVPSVGNITGAAGYGASVLQGNPSGKVPPNQIPDLSQYGPDKPYSTFAEKNPLGPTQASLRYYEDQARANDVANKILKPYEIEVTRQALNEEAQRQLAAYQQTSALNTAAAMLRQAQVGGQQLGLNTSNAMDAALSGQQRRYT